MSLVALPLGEANFLAAMLNQSLTLILYTSNTTPAKTGTGSATADYTEAAGGGYASKALTYSSWTLSGSNPTNAAYPQLDFVFTGALTGSATITGYAVKCGSIIVYAERASSGFTPANNGDTYSVNLNIGDQ